MMSHGRILWMWAAVVGVCLSAIQAHGWGVYQCQLADGDRDRIGGLCSEALQQSTSKVNETVASLESKLDEVLAIVREMKKVEDDWFEISGTVERDLSSQEENMTIVEEAQMSEEEEKEDNIDTEVTAAKRRQDNGDTREETEEDSTEDEDTVVTIDYNRKRYSEEEEEETGPKKGECTAQVMDDHETIGLFYMMTYQHGHCANRHPIPSPIRYCLGYCNSRTFIKRENGMWSQGNNCWSCQPLVQETLNIPLACDDGFKFEKKFQNVVSCECRACKAITE